MKVLIAVPVRDEEDRLPRLLRALSAQKGAAGLETSVHFYLDGCRDGSARILRAALGPGGLAGSMRIAPKLGPPNAGRARMGAVAQALAQGGAEDAMLLTTDADTLPDPDWIARAAADLRAVDVVAGYTRRDATTPLPARDDLEAYLERLHALRRRIDRLDYDPAPSHPWVGGANLGLRLSALRALGGFRPLPSGEDKDLVDRARHLGLKVRHSRGMCVTTSSRLQGRASGGLADALRHMQAEIGEPRVEHPADAARQYARHALARQTFARPPASADWTALARILGRSAADLQALARRLPNAEAFVMKSVPARPGTRDLPLSQASRLLAALRPEEFLDPADA